MVHKKHLIFLLLFVGGIICFLNLFGVIGFDYDYRVSYLSRNKLKFEELPMKIQTGLSDGSIQHLIFQDGGTYHFLIFDKDKNRYKSAGVLSGPYVKYNLLIDTQKNIVYRVERATPSPCFILDEKLYIADEFSFYLDSTYKQCKYYEYKLKQSESMGPTFNFIITIIIMCVIAVFLLEYVSRLKIK